MNRKQQRAIQQRKTKELNLSQQKQEILENLPIATLIAGINNNLGILWKRGISISDWDKKERKLYGLKVYNGRAYFLAADLDKSGQIKEGANESERYKE